MEELRQREANFTALQAIGPRKKPKLEVPTSASNGSSMVTLFSLLINLLRFFLIFHSEATEGGGRITSGTS